MHDHIKFHFDIPTITLRNNYSNGFRHVLKKTELGQFIKIVGKMTEGEMIQDKTILGQMIRGQMIWSQMNGTVI